MQSRLTVLDSGSHGNGYILESCGEQLIIECGVPFKECNKALNGKIENVQGVIVSHAHSDHLGYVKQYLKHGLSIWSCPEVSCIENRVHDMKPLLKYHIGDFYVCPLKSYHNAECLSFIIDHESLGRVAFITDSYKWPYKVNGVTNWIIEANNDENLRIKAMCENQNVMSQSQWHMNIDETISVLQQNRSPECMGVYLMHLSDSLSDAKSFEHRVKNEIGVECHAVSSGDKYTLRTCDF